MAQDEGNDRSGRLNRRQLVLRGGAGAGGLLIAGTAAACGGSGSGGSSGAGGSAGTIKIGFVSPLTGPAAGFGEPDPYVVGLAKKAFAKGIVIAGKTWDVQIIEKDNQATPSVSAQVANDLIHSEGVDLLLATSTPESVNPASDAAEAAGVPCVSTVVPWEAWYFGRGAKPGAPSPFRFTYHFCFGVEQFAHTYTHLWPQVPTNKTVGVMWPNDADGNAIRAEPRAAAQEGRLHDHRPGRLPGRDERLLVPDRPLQVEELPDLQHLPDPARLRHLLAPGRAAGLTQR